jgi:PhnB protein
MAVDPVPPDRTGVITNLYLDVAAGALEFYGRAFGAKELSRSEIPDGRIIHAEMELAGGIVYLADDFPEMNDGRASQPRALGGTTVGLHFFVPDVDAAFEQAVGAGATPKMPPMDMFWGDRHAQVVDPFGHEWSIATRVREVSPEEAAAAAAAWFGADDG